MKELYFKRIACYRSDPWNYAPAAKNLYLKKYMLFFITHIWHILSHNTIWCLELGGPNDIGSALYFSIIRESKNLGFFGLSIKMFLANQFRNLEFDLCFLFGTDSTTETAILLIASLFNSTEAAVSRYSNFIM